MSAVMNSLRAFIAFAALGCAGWFPLPAIAEDTPVQAIDAAKAAIELARRAGAEKDAADDFAAARSWLAQADKANSVVNNLVSMVVTAAMKKAREDEIVYLASMARVKAQTAEAKAKKVAALTELKAAQKTLDEFQNALALARTRPADADNKGAAADAKALEEAKRRVAELEAAREQDAKRAAERQKELDAANAEKQKLAQMQAKLQAMEEQQALQAMAGRIAGARVTSADRNIVISLPAGNVFTPANDLSAAGRQSLDSVAAVLNAYPNRKAVIRAYTDDRGGADVNQKLSERRAQRVREYLVGNQNVAGSRVTAEGAGAADPVATNATEQGRAQNRRVDVSVLALE